jgi:serine protease
VSLPRLLAIAVLSLMPLAAQAAAPASVDRIIVRWQGATPSSTPATAERVRGLAGRLGQTVRSRHIGGGMSVLQLPAEQQGTELAATLRALNADPDIEFAEPDQWVRIQAYTPNDPLFTDGITFGDATHPSQFYERQWYLRSGQISSIRADAAWDISRGSGAAASPVVVAVIDTGVRLDHPDLAGKLLPGFDFVSTLAVANDGDGWDTDPSDPGDFMTALDLVSPPFAGKDCSESNSSWHGTRVAGLVGADTDNGTGIASAGFNVRIVPVRALGKCGGSASDVIAAMYWAAGLSVPPPLLQSTNLTVNAYPARVINMSLGSDGACSAAYAAAVSDVTEHGVLVVASAGNEGAAVGSPASCAGALAVAGLRHAGTKVGYSNLGPEVGIGAPAGNCVFVAVAADPCVFALNTTTNSGAQGPQANSYSSPSFHATFGTSFSSPLVAGTASLMKNVNPALTPALIIARIKETARAFPATSIDASPQPPACVPPAENPLQSAECICNTQVCGAGMLNAHGAVLAAQRPVVFARVTGVVGAGRLLTLDGSQSAASTGRTIVSHAWSVASTSGGASAPTIVAPTQAVATVLSPSAGSYVLRLTVTDNLGSSDSALVTVTATGGTSTSPPPAPAGDSDTGGGGAVSITLLLLAACLLLARRMTPFARD